MNHGNTACRYLAKEPIASALNDSPSSAFYSFPVFLLEPDQWKPDLERRQSYKCAVGKAKGLAAAAGARLDTWVTPHRESAVAAMISQACRQLHQRTTQPREKTHTKNSPAASRSTVQAEWGCCQQRPQVALLLGLRTEPGSPRRWSRARLEPRSRNSGLREHLDYMC